MITTTFHHYLPMALNLVYLFVFFCIFISSFPSVLYLIYWSLWFQMRWSIYFHFGREVAYLKEHGASLPSTSFYITLGQDLVCSCILSLAQGSVSWVQLELKSGEYPWENDNLVTSCVLELKMLLNDRFG